jgi:hypothetical protein
MYFLHSFFRNFKSGSDFLFFIDRVRNKNGKYFLFSSWTLTLSFDCTSCQEFGRTRMAPILRRAGSVATGGKHREYRIECNHKGPRFVDSTTALQLWLNGKQNQGSCQDVFSNNINCLCHLTAFDSNMGPLDSKRRRPTAGARHFNRRSRRNGHLFQYRAIR